DDYLVRHSRLLNSAVYLARLLVTHIVDPMLHDMTLGTFGVQDDQLVVPNLLILVHPSCVRYEVAFPILTIGPLAEADGLEDPVLHEDEYLVVVSPHLVEGEAALGELSLSLPAFAIEPGP